MQSLERNEKERDLINQLSTYDNLIILLYLAVTLGIGLYLSQSRNKTGSDYFLAGRNLGWFAVGVSLFATNISSEHIIGLAGSGASVGIIAGHFEWMAVIFLVLLGWIFVPVFRRSGVMTMPEFLGKRFDKRSRNYLTGISIFAYMFTKLSLTIFAGGLLLKAVMGWDMFTTAIIMILLTGLYTVIGGMRSVVYTQIFQAFVLILGAVLVTLIGINEVGGIGALTSKLPDRYFELFRPVTDSEFPWTGIIFGAPILALWYWCTDQYIVQRVLSAKGEKAAKKGTLLAGGLKLLPVLIFMLPGMTALVLYPEARGDQAFPMMVAGDLLPVGIKGIVIAGLFAALMSSLASVFNSTAILITNDIYKPRRPDAPEEKLVLIGRLSTTLIVFAAILIVPLMKLIGSGIYIYLQSVQAYISPPIAAVFLLGIFWKQATSSGAIAALVTGGVLGFLRIILQLGGWEAVNSIPLLGSFASMNYLHFAVMLFGVSVTVMALVSIYASERIPVKNIEGLLYRPKKYAVLDK